MRTSEFGGPPLNSEVLKSNIYKLAHHGAVSQSSNSQAFLDAVNPEVVIGSSDFADSQCYHPRCEVFERLKAIPNSRLRKKYEVQRNGFLDHTLTCGRSRGNYAEVVNIVPGFQESIAVYQTSIIDFNLLNDPVNPSRRQNLIIVHSTLIENNNPNES